MHRNKDVIFGEDGYTNRGDNAPRRIFSLIGFALKFLKSFPTCAIEQFSGRPEQNTSPVLRLNLHHFCRIAVPHIPQRAWQRHSNPILMGQ
jgi:hypothetical protein